MKLFYYLWIFLTCTSLASAYTEIPDKEKQPLLTLAEQKRAKIRLENGLEFYLISDPKAQNSGAALLVEVGNWHDPKEAPGTAHFLEHMLFLGTEAYPKESDYHHFIFQHGGKCNAYTAAGCTAYFFTINHAAYDESLKRFSAFFKAPLFNPSGIERERNIVDQEFAKNANNDDIRLFFVLKALCHPEHPHHKFGTGNLITLQDVSRDYLLKWYKQHYSAHLMKGILISPLPLDTLTALAEANFGGIVNNQTPLQPPQTTAFPEDVLGQLILIEPLRNQYQLTVRWEMPVKFCDMQDCKPAELIAYALGHEGEESLLAQLKRENLAEELSCGAIRQGPNLTLVTVSVDLTKEGLKDYQTVIARLFQAIASMQERGIPPYLFDEYKQLATLDFQYQPRQDEFTLLKTYTQMLSGEATLENFPEQKTIVQNYRPETIAELLTYLSPKNGIYALQAPQKLTGLTYDRKEKWYGTAYTVVPFKENVLSQWSELKPHEQIGIPSPNPFVPADLALIHNPVETAHLNPIQLEKNDKFTAYFLADTHYGAPKICYLLSIATPALTYENPTSFVLADLTLKAAEENLRQTIYQAGLAGLNLTMQRANDRLLIQIDGYSEKAEPLLKTLLRELSEINLTKERFKTYKAALQKNYQNFDKESSLLHGIEWWNKTLFSSFFTKKQLDMASRRLTYEQMQSFLDTCFSKTHIFAFIAGNISQTQAFQVLKEIEENLPGTSYPIADQPKKKILRLPQNGPFMLERKSKTEGNVALLALEVPECTYRQCAIQRVLMAGIKGPFFETLRTKQKTAYLVISQAEEVDGRLFNLFAIQSNTHQPFELLARFELFLESYAHTMGRETMTHQEFDQIKASLISLLEQTPPNIIEASQLLAKLAFKDHADFDRREKIASALKELTYADFLKEAKEMISRKNKLRLGLLLQGKHSQNDDPFRYRTVNSQELHDISSYESVK